MGQIELVSQEAKIHPLSWPVSPSPRLRSFFWLTTPSNISCQRIYLNLLSRSLWHHDSNLVQRLAIVLVESDILGKMGWAGRMLTLPCLVQGSNVPAPATWLRVAGRGRSLAVKLQPQRG